MNKKIGLIGGGGFIGSALKNHYKNLGYAIVSYEIARNNINTVSNNIKTILTSSKSDFIDVSHLADCDLVFYLIGGDFKSQSGYFSQFQASIPIFEKFLEDISLLITPPKIILFSSAGTVYGSSKDLKIESDCLNPFGSYGVVKSSMESVLQDSALTRKHDFLILRVSNPYGIGQIGTTANGFIVNVLKNHFNGSSIKLSRDLDIYRDYIFIDDLCDSIYRLILNNAQGIFNVSSGISYSLNQVIDLIKKAGIEFNTELVDYVKPAVKFNYVSNDKLLKVIGNYQFLSIEEGINEIIKTFSREKFNQ